MKKLLMLSLTIAGMAVVISSCEKPDIQPPNNGGGNPPNPTVPGAPFLTVSLTSDDVPINNGDTVWYKSTVKCSFSSDGVVKKDGSDEISNPLIFTNVTGPVSFQLVATKTVNGVTSAPTKVDVRVPVRTENKTSVCKEGSWQRTHYLESNSLSSPTETPVGYISTQVENGWIFKFRLDNRYDLTIPGTGYYPNYKSYWFESNDTKMRVYSSTGDDVVDIESVSSSELVLTIVKPIIDINTGLPAIPNRWVKSKIVHKRI